MKRLFEYDVFISYSSKDRPWVEKLARKLKRDFRVFYDQWEIQPGENWREVLDRALSSCATGIVVFSPDAIKSGAVSAETTALLLQSWRDRRRRLIPVLYRDCELRPLIATKQYVDFRDHSQKGQEEAIERLRKALREEPLAETKPARRRRSLTTVAMVGVLIVSLPSAGLGLVVALRSQTSLAVLRREQKEVQAMEEAIAPRVGAEFGAMVAGEKTYPDTRDATYQITDIWAEGRLVFRDFAVQDRLVARDTFLYDGPTVVEKVRTYLDSDQAVFLEDHFTQDGVLTKKRHLLHGAERPAVVYLDQMRSPLPPSAVMFYR